MKSKIINNDSSSQEILDGRGDGGKSGGARGNQGPNIEVGAGCILL